jgi:hypothetical protein
MRPDEEFVKDSLVRFLDGNVEAIPGEDPPDYYFIVNGDKIAVEVTRLTPVSCDETGRPKNRLTEDCFSLDLCDRLNARFKDRFSDDYSMLLHIRGPIRNPRKFTKVLRDLIDSILISAEIAIGWKKTFEIAGNEVLLSAVPSQSTSTRRIHGAVENKDSSPFIERNAALILNERINTKQAIMCETSWTGPKWLALLNDYWLADHRTYAQVLAGMAHDFEKIFLVSDGGDVHVL